MEVRYIYIYIYTRFSFPFLVRDLHDITVQRYRHGIFTNSEASTRRISLEKRRRDPIPRLFIPDTGSERRLEQGIPLREIWIVLEIEVERWEGRFSRRRRRF